MKKILAIILSVVMVLCLFAGCSKETAKKAPSGGESTAPSGDTKPGETDKNVTGSLLVNVNAAVTLTYDKTGMVLEIKAANDEGENLLATYTEDYTGYSCADVVGKIIKDCHAINQGNTYGVVIKQNKGSANPEDKFMEKLKAAAEEDLKQIQSKAALVVLSADELQGEGFIAPKDAKLLVQSFLGAEVLDGFVGGDQPINGYYSFVVTFDGEEEVVHVNATTGSVGQGAMDDGNVEEDPEEEYKDPKEEAMDATEPSEPAATVEPEDPTEPEPTVTETPEPV